MIEESTVLILGSGASRPYGYPTAKGLRLDICKNFIDNYKPLVSGDILGKAEIEEAERFVSHFNKSDIPSIDLYLALTPRFLDIGKRAIVLSLLKAELESRFREDVSD